MGQPDLGLGQPDYGSPGQLLPSPLCPGDRYKLSVSALLLYLT